MIFQNIKNKEEVFYSKDVITCQRIDLIKLGEENPEQKISKEKIKQMIGKVFSDKNILIQKISDGIIILEKVNK